MRCDHVALTLIRRHFDIVYLLGFNPYSVPWVIVAFPGNRIPTFIFITTADCKPEPRAKQVLAFTRKLGLRVAHNKCLKLSFNTEKCSSHLC